MVLSCDFHKFLLYDAYLYNIWCLGIWCNHEMFFFPADNKGGMLLLLESSTTLEDFKRMFVEDFDMEED